MVHNGLNSVPWVRRRPFYSLLVGFSTACFLGTLASDIAYWQTANILWADFSDWLVTIGVVIGYLTVFVALVEIFAFQAGPLYRPTWLYVTGMIVALVLATFDMLVHTRDAWTSVVPWGVALSAAVVLIILVTTWMTHEAPVAADVEVAA
jgi:uncharacterized membrane protein